jgi:hypothetical protein
LIRADTEPIHAPARVSLDLVERAAWTDERLDDLLESVRTGFARTDQDIRELRTEMRQEFASLRTVMFTFGGGIIVALVGVIAAILARGA